MKALKKGDVVRIKNLTWYDSNKNEKGVIRSKFRNNFIPIMKRFCGQLATVIEITNGVWIKLDIDNGENFWDCDFFEESSPLNQNLDKQEFEQREDIDNDKIMEKLPNIENNTGNIGLYERERESLEEQPKKKRGRKPGSKNKPKEIKVVKQKPIEKVEEKKKEEVFIEEITTEISDSLDFLNLLDEFIIENELSYKKGMMLKAIFNRDKENFDKYKNL